MRDRVLFYGSRESMDRKVRARRGLEALGGLQWFLD